MLCNSDAKKDLIKRDAHSSVFAVTFIRLTLGSICQQSDRYAGVSQVDSFAAWKASWMISFLPFAVAFRWWNGEARFWLGELRVVASAVFCLFRCFSVTN